MALTEEARVLARQHMPILWLAHDEAFLPVDAEAILTISKLFDGKDQLVNPQPTRLVDLPQGKGSEKFFLKLEELDGLDFIVPPQHRLEGRVGPAALAALARRLYGRDLPGPDGPQDALQRLKVYARVSEINITFRTQSSHDRRVHAEHRDAFGHFKLIEYFFFYVYNDHWNQHQGDWDGQVNVYSRDGEALYAVYRFHHEAWATQCEPALAPPAALGAWLDEWQRFEAMRLPRSRLGKALTVDGHPLAFVAQGAHGVYPTPGFTLSGVGKPLPDVLASADAREIGAKCIHPPEVTRERIARLLTASSLSTERLRLAAWPEPELVDGQAWLGYRGSWGQRGRFDGWDGPKMPPISRPAEPNLTELIYAALSNGYTSAIGAIRNWHGV